MGVESRLISRTISHGLEFSRGSGTFAIENWPERWGAASQAVIRIRRPAVWDRSESSLLVSTSSCARLRNGSSAAIRVVSRGIRRYIQRRDPFVVIGCRACANFLNNWTSPNGQLVRALYDLSIKITQLPEEFARSLLSLSTQSPFPNCGRISFAREGFFIGILCCETDSSCLKRNCEHLSAYIDKQITFLYL